MHILDSNGAENVSLSIVQAVTEVLNKSHYGNSHFQMRQNLVTIAEHSGHSLVYLANELLQQGSRIKRNLKLPP